MPARSLACRRDRAALANGNRVGVAREPLGLGAPDVARAFWVNHFLRAARLCARPQLEGRHRLFDQGQDRVGVCHERLDRRAPFSLGRRLAGAAVVALHGHELHRARQIWSQKGIEHADDVLLEVGDTARAGNAAGRDASRTFAWDRNRHTRGDKAIHELERLPRIPCWEDIFAGKALLCGRLGRQKRGIDDLRAARKREGRRAKVVRREDRGAVGAPVCDGVLEVHVPLRPRIGAREHYRRVVLRIYELERKSCGIESRRRTGRSHFPHPLSTSSPPEPWSSGGC